jgi:hypothetical protein
VGSRIKSDTQSHREEGEAATNVSAKSPKSTLSPTAKKKGSREEKQAIAAQRKNYNAQR